jgi:hypothetical protein
MSHWEATSYFAAGMVLVAFGMKDMIPLRIVAMLSNPAFVTYRLGLGLAPVVAARRPASAERMAPDAGTPM